MPAYREPIHGPSKTEGQAIEAMWDQNVGDTNIVNLPKKLSMYPGHIERLGPRGRDVKGTTCLLLRAYNTIEREHQWHIVCYKPEELPHDPDWPRAHLKAFKTFVDNYGMKVSFCLGFAIKDDMEVHRNSCVNIRSTGDVSYHIRSRAHITLFLQCSVNSAIVCVQRTMTDEYYDQLVNLLIELKLQVKHDEDHKGDQSDPLQGRVNGLQM